MWKLSSSKPTELLLFVPVGRFVKELRQGCATFFVGGAYNQLQTSSWATRKFYFFNINLSD